MIMTDVASYAGDDWQRSIRWELAAEGRRVLPGVEGQMFLPKVLPGFRPRHLRTRERQTDLDLRPKPARLEAWAISLPPGFKLADSDTFAVEVTGLTWMRMIWQEEQVLRLRREVHWSRDIVPADQVGLIIDALDDAEKAEQGFWTIASFEKAEKQ
jgi:hypothetical protein